MVFSMAAINNNGELIMINDVSRAFFHAQVKRDVYVELPDEDRLPGEEGKCAKLNFSLYGTRDAALNWHEEYSQQLVANGFKQGIVSLCMFYHHQRGIRTVVHGDDYISVGMEEDLLWMEEQLKKKYEIKTQLLGPQHYHSQEVRVLNRIITLEQNGIGYEADPRHAEIMIKELGLQGCTTVSTLGTSTEGTTKEDCEIELDKQDEKQYRALVARANYMSPDRADIAFAVKELAKSMAKPTKGDWTRLKRLGRYFAGRPRLQIMFQWQSIPEGITSFSDADWVGDKNTRKSTSGGCLMLGKHLVKGLAKTQALIALSSAESELCAVLRTAAETLGLISIGKDMVTNLRGRYGEMQALH